MSFLPLETSDERRPDDCFCNACTQARDSLLDGVPIQQASPTALHQRPCCVPQCTRLGLLCADTEKVWCRQHFYARKLPYHGRKRHVEYESYITVSFAVVNPNLLHPLQRSSSWKRARLLRHRGALPGVIVTSLPEMRTCDVCASTLSAFSTRDCFTGLFRCKGHLVT